MLGSLWVPRGKKTPFNNRLIRMERTSWFERLLLKGYRSPEQIAWRLYAEQCDREGDTVAGKGHRGVLISMVERKSRYTVTGHRRTKCKDLVADEIIEKMKDYREVCKTITYDNA